MFLSDSQEQLIGELAGDLEPVRRLPSPGRHALVWLIGLTAVATALALTCDSTTAVQRAARSPEICMGAVASMLTALLGAGAALALSRPDRRESWAFLTAPAAILWIVSGAIGCLRHAPIAADDVELSVTTQACILSILGAAMPLSMMLMALLRYGYSLRPGSTSTLCGLSSAAAAATLVNVLRPHDAADACHLALHGLAVGVIVISNRVLGHWVLDPEKYLRRRNRDSSRRE
jgi:hypothetical protein